MDTQRDDLHRAHALHVHAKLTEQLQTLKFLEYELRNRLAQGVHERTRARAAGAALVYLLKTLTALEDVGRE